MCSSWLSAFIVFISISIMKCCEYGELKLSKEKGIHDGGKLQSFCEFSKFNTDEDFALQWFVDDYLVHTCTKAAKEDDFISCYLNVDLPLYVHGVLKCSVLNMSKHPNEIGCTTPSKIIVRDQPRVNVHEGGNGTFLDVYTGKQRYIATCTIQKALEGYQLNWLISGKTSLLKVIAKGTEKLRLILYLEKVSRRLHNMKMISCVYQNQDGYVLDAFHMKLAVKDTPKISVTGLNEDIVTVKYGESISATCSVANALRATRLIWTIETNESTRTHSLNSTDAVRRTSSNISVDLHLEVLKKHHDANLSCVYYSDGYSIKQKSFTIFVSGLDGDSFKWEYIVIGVLGLIALCSLIAVILFFKLKCSRGTPDLDKLTSEARTPPSFVQKLQSRPLPKVPRSEQANDITEDTSRIPPGYMEMHPGTTRTPIYDRLKIENVAKDETRENADYETIDEPTDVKIKNIQKQNQKHCKPSNVRFSIRLNSFRTKKYKAKLQNSDLKGPVLSIRLKSSNTGMGALENRPREIVKNNYCSVLKERRNKLLKVPS